MVTFSDSSTLQGLYEHTKYLSGQSNLSIEDFTRLANFAMDDYSSIVLQADGKWKFEDSTNTETPQGYTQVTAGQSNYTLDTNYLRINRVELKVNGKWTVLSPVDQNDYKTATTANSDNGTPREYDYDGTQIILLPAPDFSDSGDADVVANNSLHVDFSRPATYFDTTDTTATIGLPRNHHQYIALKATKAVMLAGNDPSISSIERELVSWEGLETAGRLAGGKIREHFKNRDENTTRRIKPKGDNAFTSKLN